MLRTKEKKVSKNFKGSKIPKNEIEIKIDF